jgi:hypothetical protein
LSQKQETLEKKNGFSEKKMTLNAVAATTLPIVLKNKKKKIESKKEKLQK